MSYYAVHTGRTPGIYRTWAECNKQVNRFPKAKYKKFNTESEAKAFIQLDYPSYVPQSQSNNKHKNKAVKTLDFFPLKSNQKTSPQSKLLFKSSGQKRNYSTMVDGTSGSSKGNASSAQNSKKPKFNSNTVREGFDIVYTDGACKNNGKKGAIAGIGVYWGPDSPFNVSEKLEGRQTNNRAEIKAAVRAIEQAKEQNINKLAIHTDSSFMIQGITEWMSKWKKNGWKTGSGQAVKNEEDFRSLDKALQNIEIQWVHVDAHTGILGNEEADRLAREGCEM